jgi:hypothetical protein
MKERIRHILKEESLKVQLLQMIKDDGVESTAQLVGGTNNLIDIIGRSHIIDIIIGKLGELKLTRTGGGVRLTCVGLPLLDQSSWGVVGLIVYDNYIKVCINDDFLNEFYVNNRKEVIEELISRFPVLYNDEVTVYKDSGKYHKVDEFKLNN